MPASGDDRPRNVVPRWRTFEATMNTGELSPLTSLSTSRFNDDMVADLLHEFEQDTAFSIAADLVSAAFTLGRFGIADEAAKHVLHARNGTDSARSIASLYLDGAPVSDAFDASPAIDTSDLSGAIRDAKRQLRVYPLNALLWANLARSYLTIGRPKKALRAMKVALGLAPHNRHILRVASRFYLHQQDPERAHSLLAAAPQVKTDPWLLSAEIATASATDRKSTLVKTAKRVLESNRFPAFHTSELASAVGTVEAKSGSMRVARQFIRASIESPTENACAQAGWMSVNADGFAGVAQIPEKSPEANAWIAKESGEWTRSMSETKVWMRDQPFSSRPAILGSYLASTVFEDYESGAKFAKVGLVSNPEDEVLLNNLAFALAQLGQVEDAQTAISKVNQEDLNETSKVINMATHGLIAFRAGDPAAGAQNYLDAIHLARRNQLPQEFQAAIYLALEQIRAGIGDIELVRATALDAVKRIDSPLGKVLQDKLKNAAPLPIAGIATS